MLNDAMTELVARRFRALGDPTRLRILQALESGEKPVNSIVKLLAGSQPNISKHLKALCQEGLVDRRRDGMNIWYRIADPAIFDLCHLVCRDATERARSQLAQLEAVSTHAVRRANGLQGSRR